MSYIINDRHFEVKIFYARLFPQRRKAVITNTSETCSDCRLPAGALRLKRKRQTNLIVLKYIQANSFRWSVLEFWELWGKSLYFATNHICNISGI